MKKAIIIFFLATIASSLTVQAMKECTNLDTIEKKASNIILRLFGAPPEVKKYHDHSCKKIRTETVRSITASTNMVNLCLLLIKTILFNLNNDQDSWLLDPCKTSKPLYKTLKLYTHENFKKCSPEFLQEQIDSIFFQIRSEIQQLTNLKVILDAEKYAFIIMPEQCKDSNNWHCFFLPNKMHNQSIGLLRALLKIAGFNNFHCDCRYTCEFEEFETDTTHLDSPNNPYIFIHYDEIKKFQELFKVNVDL